MTGDGSPPLVTHRDVACTGCGCLCDDLTVTVADGRVTEIEPPCPLAQGHFLGRGGETGPVARIEGRTATLEAAVARAAELLRDARRPLITGLTGTDTDGSRAAVALADRLGAVLDPTASPGQAAVTLARQQVGESSATLGESAMRCDLVVVWGGDPVTDLPRLLERYALPDRPRLRPRSESRAEAEGADDDRPERTLVVVDTRRTPTAERADDVILLPDGADREALVAVRLLVAAKSGDASPAIRDAAARLLFEAPPAAETALPVRELARLADRLTSATSSVVYFGDGLTRHDAPHATVEQLFRLTIALNALSRSYARRLRGPGGLCGADGVLAWQTGYPGSVDFGHGYPRYGPGEWSATTLLGRDESDLVLAVGASGLAGLAARPEAGREIPAILLDGGPVDDGTPGVVVRFRTATPGIHHAGTAYRMDEVPIPLRPVVTSDLPTTAEVLTAIETAVRAMQSG